MGIYDKSGNILNLCRAIDGSVPSHAYNLNGDGYICATDHIFTSPNILIDEAYMDTTKRTDLIDEKVDHMPLVAHLIIL